MTDVAIEGVIGEVLRDLTPLRLAGPCLDKIAHGCVCGFSIMERLILLPELGGNEPQGTRRDVGLM